MLTWYGKEKPCGCMVSIWVSLKKKVYYCVIFMQFLETQRKHWDTEMQHLYLLLSSNIKKIATTNSNNNNCCNNKIRTIIYTLNTSKTS